MERVLLHQAGLAVVVRAYSGAARVLLLDAWGSFSRTMAILGFLLAISYAHRVSSRRRSLGSTK